MSAMGTNEVEASFEMLLVRDCSAGDDAAWRRLHERYYVVAAAFLRKLGVRDVDLEDACQDAFVQIFRYLPTFRGESELETWIYRLCITQARRLQRRARIADTLQRLLSLTPIDALLSAPSFSEQAARTRIDSALAQLSNTERAVFVLYEMEGVPGRRIAEIVGCPEATVWRRLHYARKHFRKALGIDAEEDGR